MFLPVEQEIARRRGHERGRGIFDPTLIRRAVLISMIATVAVCLVALVARPVSLKLLGGDVNLLAALCVALPGYACCYVSRGVFAGTGELGRYGLQLGVEGGFRLAGILGVMLAGWPSAAAVGWLFGAAPWIALAVSLVGRTGHRPPASVPIGRGRPLVSALGLLLVSSVAAQLLVNAGPVVVQLFATPAERAQAGAFLAALVVVRIPVFLFTAVQPSFLPAMATHAALDRKADFVRLTSRVLATCVALTVVSTVVARTGPDADPGLLRLPGGAEPRHLPGYGPAGRPLPGGHDPRAGPARARSARLDHGRMAGRAGWDGNRHRISGQRGRPGHDRLPVRRGRRGLRVRRASDRCAATVARARRHRCFGHRTPDAVLDESSVIAVQCYSGINPHWPPPPAARRWRVSLTTCRKIGPAPQVGRESGPGQAAGWGVYPGGQSENPASPWYENLVADWWNGSYLPLPPAGGYPTGAIQWTLSPPATARGGLALHG
jgi:hypothetical protein